MNTFMFNGILHDIQNVGVQKNVFYDESNNYRSVYFRNGKLNIPEDNNFVQAGIVDDNNNAEFTFEELKLQLKIHQKSLQEIKAKNIFSGDFIDVVNADRTLLFILFIDKYKYPIHVTNLNILYWVVIDIVQSIIETIDIKILLESLTTQDFYAFLNINNYTEKTFWEDHFKECKLMNFVQRKQTALLLDVARCDKKSFISLLAKHNIPNIPCPDDFINDLYQLYQANKVKIDTYGTISQEDKLLFEKCCHDFHYEKLSYIQDESETALIDNFQGFYLHIPKIMTRCNHFFDEENTIQELIAKYPTEELSSLKIRFINSKSDVRIQVSDFLAGFFAKFYTFIDNHTTMELKSLRNSLNDNAKISLALLTKAIKRCDSISRGLSVRIDSLNNCYKADLFLEDSL